VFDCFATLAHGLGVCIKALLHSFEQMLMLPSWNPSLWRRTSRHLTPCRVLLMAQSGEGASIAELLARATPLHRLQLR
jgi:hypothetical protein